MSEEMSEIPKLLTQIQEIKKKIKKQLTICDVIFIGLTGDYIFTGKFTSTFQFMSNQLSSPKPDSPGSNAIKGKTWWENSSHQ